MQVKLIYFSKILFLLFFFAAGIRSLIIGTVVWGENTAIDFLWYGLFFAFFLIETIQKRKHTWSVWKVIDILVVISLGVILTEAILSFI